MNKFNRPPGDTIKLKRANKAARRRQMGIVGKPDESAWSGARTGKHKRQDLRRWRKAQKSAIESGLVSLKDIEMMVAENEAQDEETAISEQKPDAPAGPIKSPQGFRMQKGKKAKAKSFKKKSVASVQTAVETDLMAE